MALSADVKVTRYGVPDGHQEVSQPITANATLYRGSIAATRSGYCVAMSSPTSTDVVWGLYDQNPLAANTGPGVSGASTNGGASINIMTGSFYLACSTGADALTQADVGSVVYVYDEVTVAKTNGGGTRPAAGRLVNIDTSQPGGYAVTLGNNQTTGVV